MSTINITLINNVSLSFVVASYGNLTNIREEKIFALFFGKVICLDVRKKKFTISVYSNVNSNFD